MIRFSITLLLFFLMLARVSAGDPEEVVLKPGMTIIFKNKFGSGKISYVSSLKRHYQIEGIVNKTIAMMARNKRFLGELGIFNPGARSLFTDLNSPRIVAREAELYFSSSTEARQTLMEGSDVMDWACDKQGYVVGYGYEPERKQVNVTLYRYFINGRPAKSLPVSNGTTLIVRQE